MQTAEEKATAVCQKLNLPDSGPAFAVIRLALLEQDRDTRHACAEAVTALPLKYNDSGQPMILEDSAHAACVNARGGFGEGQHTPSEKALAVKTGSDKVEIFCDGACSGNPGPGGWGAVIRAAGREYEFSGYSPETTNNQMELMAVISGLEALPTKTKVVVTTDSQYVAKGYIEWLPGWIKKGWKTTTGPVKNKDLWVRLLAAAEGHDVSFVWVKGHAGHPENERCDQMAVEAIKCQGRVLRGNYVSAGT